MENREGIEQSISLERNLENRRLNIDLALRRCQRKGLQPREYFLQATFAVSQQPETSEIADKVRQQLLEFPDINWVTASRESLADQLLEIAKPLLVAEFEQGRGNIEPAEHWLEAGILHFEFYDPTAEPATPELGTEPMMIIHLPSQADHLSRTELTDSMRQLSQILVERSDLKGVYGSSLLLEHPLFARLGFTIDEAHDDGQRPTLFIPREKFIERFGK